MTKRSELLRFKKQDCFILQPKADSQASKIPFGDYLLDWPFCHSKSLDNIVRRVDTNRTQILHRMRQNKLRLTGLYSTIIQVRFYSLTMR